MQALPLCHARPLQASAEIGSPPGPATPPTTPSGSPTRYLASRLFSTAPNPQAG